MTRCPTEGEKYILVLIPHLKIIKKLSVGQIVQNFHTQ